MLINNDTGTIYVGSPGSHHLELMNEIPEEDRDDGNSLFGNMVAGFIVSEEGAGVEEYAPYHGIYLFAKPSDETYGLLKQYYPHEPIYVVGYAGSPTRVGHTANLQLVAPTPKRPRGIFVYNPEDNTTYVMSDDSFHIDLLNYITGQDMKNPNDSFDYGDDFILGYYDYDHGMLNVTFYRPRQADPYYDQIYSDIKGLVENTRYQLA